MRRLRFFLTLLPVLALCWAAAAHSPAASADMWCFDDPVVSLNGQQVTLDVGAAGTSTYLHKTIAGATITVAVPAGVSTALVLLQNKPWPETVRFVQSQTVWSPGQPLPVTVTVSFSSSAKVLTELAATFPNGKTKFYAGTTATPLQFGFTL